MSATVKKNSLRNRELAQIHIAKQQLGLDDETYRSMLWTVGRVESSKDLDHAGRCRVLEHLTARGWKNNQRKTPSVALPKEALISKISALLTTQKLEWAYADGIAKQMFKREKVQWCDAKQLRAIIAALVKRGQK